MNYAALGWLDFGLVVLVAVVKIRMVTGNRITQVARGVVAALGAIIHLALIAACPALSVLVIIADVVVIYTIMVHGRELNLSQ